MNRKEGVIDHNAVVASEAETATVTATANSAWFESYAVRLKNNTLEKRMC